MGLSFAVVTRRATCNWWWCGGSIFAIIQRLTNTKADGEREREFLYFKIKAVLSFLQSEDAGGNIF